MHVRVHMGLAPVLSWGLVTFQDTRESSFFKPLLRADPRVISQPPVTSEFQGLTPFQEDDAQFFFGREQVLERLLRGLRQEPRFLAVLGPSGSGKSSLILAGLLPKLRQGVLPGSESWESIIVRQAADPFIELEVQGL
jgi:hypothetical protein